MKVYTVYGSEDGIIGVYGSIKKAIESAKDYFGDRKPDNTFEFYKKEVKKNNGCIIFAEDSNFHVDITTFEVE